jgi:hypothetical protein
MSYDAQINMSKASPMLRRLLNIASIVCLVACVSLMGLSVRSYYCVEAATGSFGIGRVLSVESTAGRLDFQMSGLGADRILP